MPPLESNYQVLVAADGKRSVELAQLERPTLILVVHFLPIIDG
jgi:DNA-binding response OmpR family regulator